MDFATVLLCARILNASPSGSGSVIPATEANEFRSSSGMRLSPSKMSQCSPDMIRTLPPARRRPAWPAPACARRPPGSASSLSRRNSAYDDPREVRVIAMIAFFFVLVLMNRNALAASMTGHPPRPSTRLILSRKAHPKQPRPPWSEGSLALRMTSRDKVQLGIRSLRSSADRPHPFRVLPTIWDHWPFRLGSYSLFRRVLSPLGPGFVQHRVRARLAQDSEYSRSVGGEARRLERWRRIMASMICLLLQTPNVRSSAPGQ